MGDFTGRHLFLYIAIALLGAILWLTVGGNIMWHEPPPFDSVTDASSISRTNKQVIQGSLNEELSCNFSLTSDLNITTVTMIFRGRPAVTFVPNVLPHVELAFTERFNAVWVPNKLTLIIFNVTSAEEGEYGCEVVTIGTSARTWIRKIQLLVVDQRQTRVSTLTASEDPIQTTVSLTATQDPVQTTVSFTAAQDPVQTTVSFTATQGDDQRTVIGVVVGVAVLAIIIIIIIIIAIVRFLKGRKRFQKEVCHNSQQGNEGVGRVQDGCALLGPLAADGINGNQSKRDIQAKEEDASV